MDERLQEIQHLLDTTVQGTCSKNYSFWVENFSDLHVEESVYHSYIELMIVQLVQYWQGKYTWRAL